MVINLNCRLQWLTSLAADRRITIKWCEVELERAQNLRGRARAWQIGVSSPFGLTKSSLESLEFKQFSIEPNVFFKSLKPSLFRLSKKPSGFGTNQARAYRAFGLCSAGLALSSSSRARA